MLSKPLINFLNQEIQCSRFFTNKLLRRFSNKNSEMNNVGKTVKEDVKSSTISQSVKQEAVETKQNQYIYDQKKFKEINQTEFIERIKKMEQSNQKQKIAIDGIKFPLLLISASLFTYYCWNSIPYGVVFRHATVSEYINQLHYYHAIFISSLSFQNLGHLIVYFPLMIYSLYLTAFYFRQRHMFILFFTNSLISTAVTYAYERSKPSPTPMITPKVNGAVTPLAFISAFFAIKPNYMIMNSRALPFFIIPVTYYMYEWYEFRKGFINEVCRPAHFSAIIYGFIFGLIFKRYKL